MKTGAVKTVIQLETRYFCTCVYCLIFVKIGFTKIRALLWGQMKWHVGVWRSACYPLHTRHGEYYLQYWFSSVNCGLLRRALWGPFMPRLRMLYDAFIFMLILYCTVHDNIMAGQLSRYSDLLRFWRSENEIPVGSRFSALIQSSPVPSAPISSKLGYKVSCLGIKWPERVVDHPPPFSAEVKGRVQVYLYSPSGLLWLVLLWTATLNSKILQY